MYADCLSGQSALTGAIGNQCKASWCVCVCAYDWWLGAGAGEIPRNPIFLGSLPFGVVYMLWLLYVHGWWTWGSWLGVFIAWMSTFIFVLSSKWVWVLLSTWQSVTIVLRQSRRGCPALCPVFSVIDREHIRVSVTSIITLIPQTLQTILVYEKECV